eukprot:tig00000114_g6058.t1
MRRVKRILMVRRKGPKAPPAPLNLVASAPNDQQQPVSLSWTAVDGATGYKIYRDGDYLDDSATNSYSDATTVWGTGYEFQISATNSVGEGPRSIIVYVTTDPAAPSGVTVTGPTLATPSTIVLSWSGVVGATGYKVYRNGTLIASPDWLTFSYSDSADGLFGTAVTYYVVAAGATDDGPQSSTASLALAASVFKHVFGSSLIQEYDASSVTGIGTVPANNTKVASWYNLAESSQPASQATDGNRPTFYSASSRTKGASLPAIRFTKSLSNFMNFPVTPFSNVAFPGGFSICLVYSPYSVNTAAGNIWFSGTSPPSAYMGVQDLGTGGAYVANIDSSAQTITTSTSNFSASAMRVFLTDFSASGIRVFNPSVSSGASQTVTPGVYTTAHNPTAVSRPIGNIGGYLASYIDAEISHILIFNRLLTAEERTAMLDHLYGTWVA